MASLNTNLLAYYNFDGNSNAAYGGLNGTDTSISYKTGKINQCAEFNGSTSLISLGSSPFTGSGNFTVAAWIKTSTSAGFPGVVGFGTEAFGSAIFLGLAPSGVINFDIYGVGGVLQGATNVADGTWHLIGGVFSGGRFQCWLDGATDGGNAAASPNVGSNYCTFWKVYSGGAVLTGQIDMSGIWSRALDVSDWSTLYNGGTGKQYPFTLNTNRFFHFFN